MPPAAGAKGTRSMRRAGNLSNADVVDIGGDPAYRRELKAQDRKRSRAYEAGRQRGKAARRERGPREPQGDDELDELFTSGEHDGRRERRRERTSSAMAPVISRAGGGAKEASGFLLGLLAYAVAVNYLRGGPDQVRAWTRAKFLNDTASTREAAASSSSIGSSSVIVADSRKPKPKKPAKKAKKKRERVIV